MRPSPSVRFLARCIAVIALVLSGSLASAGKVYTEGPDQPAEHSLPADTTNLARANRPAERDASGILDGKIEFVLRQLIDEYSARGLEAALAYAGKMEQTISGDTILVVVETEAGGVGETVDLVESSGGAVASTSDNLLLVYLPLSAIESIASSTSIIRVRRPLMATGGLASESGSPSSSQPLVGPSVFNSEGVSVIGAGTWQSAGFDGAGVKVGVIGLGFSGYESLRGTELPPAGRVVAQNFRSDGNFSGTVLGSACAEVVYDVAPGATLYLAGIGNDVEFGSAVDWLVANGVSVVSLCVSFIGYNNYDGTGYIDSKVNAARTAGAFVVAGTGDFAQRHWDGLYTDTDGDGWHQFTGVVEVNGLYAYAGQRITAVMTWNDSWASPTSDYDLYLYRWGDFSNHVAISEAFQGPGVPPYEVIGYDVSQEGWYALAMWRYSGSARTLDLYSAGHNLDYTVASSSLGSPADATGAVAVGVFDHSTGIIRGYSSQGPTNDGRAKPELSAPDGVSTASYGIGNFRSQVVAASHTAGAAALVKQAYPAYTPSQILTYLEGRAIDAGAAGKDNIYGTGKLHLGNPPARLGLSTTSLNFLADAQSNPSPQQLSISNSGGGSMTWTASEGYSWLSINSNSGSAPATVQVSVDKTQVTSGDTVSGQITINGTSAGTINTPQYVTVTFKYSSQPLTNVFLPMVLKAYSGSW